jgi:probable HAF family extracellular repeat protein
MFPIRCCAIAAVALCGAFPMLADKPSFQGLGDLPGGYPDFSEAAGISADGRVAVGRSSSSRTQSDSAEAFRWTRDQGMIGLGGLRRPVDSRAYGASYDGAVIVGFSASDSGSQEAFRWTADDGMMGLGDLYDGDERTASVAGEVSADGIIVGWAEDKFRLREAFQWTADDGMEGLGFLWKHKSWSAASAVSRDGSVIAGAAVSDEHREGEGFRLEAGEMDGLGTLYDDEISWAASVSDDGRTIVGSSGSDDNSVQHAFRHTVDEGMIALEPGEDGLLPENANDTSADGWIIVGAGSRDGARRAFIWDPEHGTRDRQDLLTDEYGFDLSDWDLREATAVSADGRTIVGTGRHIGVADSEAWIAHIGKVNPGDVNCDHDVNFDDIDPFVLALTDPDGYDAQYGETCDIKYADVNPDGIVDFDDIDPFVCCLIRGSCYDCR